MKQIQSYKDRCSRGTILSLGIALLLSVNGFFLIIVRYQSYTLMYVLFLCLLGWMYWKKWRVYSTLCYKVDDSRIEIRVRGSLVRTIERDACVSLEQHQSLDTWRRGVYTTMEGLHARLASSNLTKITLEHGEVIWLSGEIH